MVDVFHSYFPVEVLGFGYLHLLVMSGGPGGVVLDVINHTIRCPDGVRFHMRVVMISVPASSCAGGVMVAIIFCGCTVAT